MAFIAWITMGLIAAAVAKSIFDFTSGWLATIALAVTGATVAGWMAAILTGNSDLPFFSLGHWALAILGCLLVLWGYQRVTTRAR